MSTPSRRIGGDLSPSSAGSRGPAQLADVLERVLDKGIVIAGDIQINLLDIELLTIRLRLLVASADKAKEMGIDWWQDDPFLGRGKKEGALEDRLKRLERAAGIDGDRSDRDD
jgi:Gas vesicle protein